MVFEKYKNNPKPMIAGMKISGPRAPSDAPTLAPWARAGAMNTFVNIIPAGGRYDVKKISRVKNV